MKSEVRRGRKFVEYHDPETQDEFTFTQEISGADVSYQETVGGSWLPVNESWETDGQDGFSLRAHRMNHKVRFDSIGAWRWYPRRNVETEYIVINRPQCWLTATKRWGNLLVNGISREGRDITLTSVRKVTRVIHSSWNGIKTDWILLDSTAPTKFRQQIDLVGLTELDGWLYGADGEKVALLTPTTAIDADGAELPCSGTYADGYLQFEADITGAAYPVRIDPDFSGIPSAGDTALSTIDPDRNFGSSKVWHSGFALTSFLWRWDLSSIDSSNIATAATFAITTVDTGDNTGSYTMNCYSVTQANGDWIPGTANGAQQMGSPCSSHKVYNTVTWASGSGNKACATVNTDYESTLLVGVAIDWTDGDNSRHTGTFTAAGLTRITDWFGSPNTNYGLVAPDVTRRYPNWIATSNNDTESYRPVLTVTYTAAATGALRRTNMNAQMSNLTGGMHG